MKDEAGLGKKRTCLINPSELSAANLPVCAVAAEAIKRIQDNMVKNCFNETNLNLLPANYKLFLTIVQNLRTVLEIATRRFTDIFSQQRLAKH